MKGKIIGSCLIATFMLIIIPSSLQLSVELSGAGSGALSKNDQQKLKFGLNAKERVQRATDNGIDSEYMYENLSETNIFNNTAGVMNMYIMRHKKKGLIGFKVLYQTNMDDPVKAMRMFQTYMQNRADD